MIPYQQTLRLFVAVELSPGVRRKLADAQRRLAPECPDVRWTREDALHLTMRFIGDAPVGQVEALAKALTAQAREVEPVDLRVEGLGCFPAAGRVRVVWAGAEEETGDLARLAQNVDRALAELGYPSDGKPFRPHITLGRLKEDSSGGAVRRAVESAAFRGGVEGVDELVLMASDLSSRGPKYSVISHHALGEIG